MNSLDTSSQKLGLRERKKQQTREKIAQVALRLFAERGYDHTTLAEIAEAADVAPRTIFAYFESKEDILLCGERSFLDDLKRRLDERPAGTTTVDALREFLSEIPPQEEDDLLRKKVMSENPELQMKAHAGHTRLEPMLAQSIAKDLGAKPDDLQPMLAAASVTAAFISVRDRIFAAEAGGEPMTHEQAMATLDQVLDFLRGGLEALQQA
ncbi:MAG: TetR/AcrR family transcriptional regulator [Solirubrobacteraceae bacterium]